MRGLSLDINFNFQGTGWYEAIAGELVRVIEDLPMWTRWTQVRVRRGTPEPLTAAALASVARAASTTWEITGDETNLTCSHFDATLLVGIDVVDSAWRAHASELEDIAQRFIAALPGGAVLPLSGIRLHFSPDLPWTRLPDRGAASYLSFENVVSFFDRRLIARWSDVEGGPVMARIVDAAVPATARRSERDGVVIVSFTDALTDEDALAAARMAHERWLAAQAWPPIGLGDRRVVVSGQVNAPPLSFVDARARVGFKTVVVFPDGSKQDEAWRAASRIAKAGTVEGFGALAGVYVIVPLRPHAVALAASAEAAGLAGVVYPDDSGGLWRVAPDVASGG